MSSPCRNIGEHVPLIPSAAIAALAYGLVLGLGNVFQLQFLKACLCFNGKRSEYRTQVV